MIDPIPHRAVNLVAATPVTASVYEGTPVPGAVSELTMVGQLRLGASASGEPHLRIVSTDNLRQLVISVKSADVLAILDGLALLVQRMRAAGLIDTQELQVPPR